MYMDITEPKETYYSSNLNRNSEAAYNCLTDDYISENDHAFIKKVLEKGESTLDSLIDELYPPICNFHTSYYKTIHSRWG